jgi:hypothetical protein
MDVVDRLRRLSGSLSSEATRLAVLLRDDPGEGLARLVRFAAGLADRLPSPDARLARLEALRPAWRHAVAVQLAPLRRVALPLARDELLALHRVLSALAAVRDADKRIHADLLDGTPGERPSPRALLALARALDAQSHRLVTAARLRIALPRDDWDELCRLAVPLADAVALDERFAEPEGGHIRTPRESLALPLLLRLLESLGLADPGLRIACAVAQGAARRTGVRIDLDGLPHVCADGPAMMLSKDHTVRLDTRPLCAWLARSRARLDAGEPPAAIGMRTILSKASAIALLEQLATVWGPGYVPSPLMRPPLSQAVLHVGLPRRIRAADTGFPAFGAPAEETVPEATPTGGAGRSPYVYGRSWLPHGVGTAPLGEAERLAAVTIAEAARRAGADAAVMALMNAVGEPVVWRGRDARRSVFSRATDSPRLRLGQLVAVLPMRAADRIAGVGRPRLRPGSGPSRLHVGRVATLVQTGTPDAREPFGHDVGVVFWPGAPLPVRVRLGDASAFEDAWWLPVASGGDPSSLVVRRERFEEPGPVVVRDAAGERVLRLVGLLERGSDFDRIEVSDPA